MRYLMLILVLSLFFSCEKEAVYTFDCDFEQVDSDMDGLIDDKEQEAMNECSENQYTTLEDIKENLIGEWELIGHGEGWTPIKSMPCAYMEVSEDEIHYRYTDANNDFEEKLEYELKEFQTTTGIYFLLETTPNDRPGLGLNVFCPQYMYVNATPFDGDMFLYEKRK